MKPPFGIVLLLLLLAGRQCGARTKAVNNTPRETDSGYIQNYPDQFTIRLYAGEKFAGFSFKAPEQNAPVVYRPNPILSVGAGFTYRGIGLDVAIGLPDAFGNDEKFGRTRRFDLQVHKYSRKLAVDAYLQRYRGFHLESLMNAPTYIAGGPGNETLLPYFKDMLSVKAVLTALYVFKGTRFSMGVSVDQQEWQTRSAGSPLVGISVAYQELTNRGQDLLPADFPEKQLFNGHNPMRIQTYGLTLQGGYGYTYVFRKNWAATLATDIGMGLGTVNMEARTIGIPTPAITETTASEITFNGRINIRAGLAYNKSHYTVSVYGIAGGDLYNLPQVFGGVVRSSGGIVRLVFAKRFAAHRNRK